MNKKLVFIFRVHNKLVDFISFKLFLPYLEEVVDIEIALPDIHVPDTNIAARISNKEAAISIKAEAIRMNVIKASVPQPLGALLSLAVLAVGVNYQLQCSIVNNFVIVYPLILRVLRRALGLIHYIHFAYTHLSLALAVRIHG